MITFKHKGDFKLTTKFLNKVSGGNYLRNLLDQCGQEGVEALRQATPKDTGLTANSWTYEVTNEDGNYAVNWINTNVQNGYFNVALMIQLGHGTGSGAYIQGIDYINPALQPVFDRIADKAWKAVNDA